MTGRFQASEERAASREFYPFRISARVMIAVPGLAVRGLIQVYRYTFSFLFGRTCRHLPTCSEYADLAIKQHGLWAGLWMALARFWRCRPFGSHGFDPVPQDVPSSARWYLPWRYGFWTGRHIDT